MMRIKKILLAFTLLLLSAPGAFASAVSPDVALVDAGIVRQTIAAVERMVLPREFEAAFGQPVETQNMGADVYRNLDWRVSLVSTDRPLDLHVGFNYGKRAEWSMSIDSGDAGAGRRYFAALSRGFEQLTEHVSPVIRIEPPLADSIHTSLNTYYPLDADRMLSISTVTPVDSDALGEIFLTPTPAATADYFTVLAKSGDVISLDIFE